MYGLKHFFSFRTLSPYEKIVSFFLLIAFLISLYIYLFDLSLKYSKRLPARGGQLTELIDSPARFINPVFASSDTDLDITELVYSGLLRSDGQGGLRLELAESYQISDDAKEYTFKIRDKAVFQDGRPVTAKDVKFTIDLIQNPLLKSPRFADWLDVKVEIVDDKTIKFILPKPYSMFLENLSIGILPEHIWSHISTDEMQFSIFNENAIGAGPYKVEEIIKTDSGIPAEYILVANGKYIFGKPHIKRIKFKILKDDNEKIKYLNNDKYTSVAALPYTTLNELDTNMHTIYTLKYPRVFALFLNKDKNNLFVDFAVRDAIDNAIDKKGIVDHIFKGYADVLCGPVPRTCKYERKNPKEIMQKAGWKINKEGIWEKKGKKAEFSLAYPSEGELKDIAFKIQSDLQKSGFKVNLHSYKVDEIIKIIRDRDFDAVLFGQSLGRANDLYAFWHSSQKDDPGLNIVSYANKKVDKWSKDLRKTKNKGEREELMNKIYSEVSKEKPAIFLYSPHYVYVLPKNMKGFDYKFIAEPYERFDSVHRWFYQTQQVWNFLVK